jgi:anti-sigma factor ChrR (cupin superfamily)
MITAGSQGHNIVLGEPLIDLLNTLHRLHDIHWVDRRVAQIRTIGQIIRADTGDWEDVSDKIKKKILHVDENSGIETYLLKIEAGAKDAPHIHTSDEHCIVLEGDVCFGDIHLNAGDYHLAPKGSKHDEAYSVHGALLYIQTGLEQPLPV